MQSHDDLALQRVSNCGSYIVRIYTNAFTEYNSSGYYRNVSGESISEHDTELSNQFDLAFKCKKYRILSIHLDLYI